MKLMRLHLRRMFASLGLMVCCGNLNADVITTGQLPITRSGQNILLNVNGPLFSSGDGTLTFTAQGDFDDGIGESVNLYLDGNFIGTSYRGAPGTTFTKGGQLGILGLHTLQASFNVNAATLQTILGADTNVLFRLDLTPFVGGTQAFTGDYVSASLSYNVATVPEPTSFAALTIVSGGLMVYRRFKSRKQAA